MKSILSIGTAHEFQTVGNPWEQQFRGMLSSVVSEDKIQVILEEWNDNRGIAVGKMLETAELRWENVGTQDLPELRTFVGYISNKYDLKQAKYEYFAEYPFDIQEKREQFMPNRISELRQGNRISPRSLC